MICQDGFITSHAVMNIELLEDEEVKNFVGEYEPEEFLLNPGKPIAVGPYSVSNYAMEARKNQEEALERSKEVILEVAKKFKDLSGREYGLFEEYKTEDADYIMVLIGSAAGTASTGPAGAGLSGADPPGCRPYRRCAVGAAPVSGGGNSGPLHRH